MNKIKSLLIFSVLLQTVAMSQGYLHTQGKYIYNGSGEEVILRGIGTGNWMLQEGYMMQSSAVANTQHEFRAKLIQTIGVAKTDSFYNAWLHSHFTRTDVDSMKSWGFNSIRVAMHYKWLTLPIEEEPVPGSNTWLENGFNLLDSLLDWCSDNQMYLILDLHGAPGGQGKDAAISDYDPSKPSLWESQENKSKTIALWRKLAEKYANEPWIGGYDLINETNWKFPEGNNSQLRNLFGEIITAIREVDTNHIVILEGNSWANDYTGLTPDWDDNMVYSFHKYWTYNTQNEINFILNLSNTYNVPIWLGESGENSNTWFTNLIALCELNKIGWSWWPVKKAGINNPLRVIVNSDYSKLMNYWAGTGPALSVDEAFQAVLTFAENHKIENCIFQKDVVDAMIRQPHANTTLPYINHSVTQTIFATDYDMGRYNIAYHDLDSANYHQSENGKYTNWNQGWSYRNDGVDIEACQDVLETNGYDVGWTTDGEWMQYTFQSDSLAAYTLNIRSASGGTGSKIHLELEGIPITESIILPGTSGWKNWQTTQLQGIIIPAGTHQLKFVSDKGGSNINFLKFINPVPVENVSFQKIKAESSSNGKTIYLIVNKEISSPINTIPVSDFEVVVDGIPVTIKDLFFDTLKSRMLEINLEDPVIYGSVIYLSYNGSSILNYTQPLETFTNFVVENKLPVCYDIPGKIQSEDFYFNNGLQLETCTDAGGGFNTGYANAGDYLDYLINVKNTGEYKINFRVATTAGNAQIFIQKVIENNIFSLDTVKFTSTGGWQNWQNQSGNIYLEKGRYTLRIFVRQGEHNLNWFELVSTTGIESFTKPNIFKTFPNPVNDELTIEFPGYSGLSYNVSFYNAFGQLILQKSDISDPKITLDLSSIGKGIFLLIINSPAEIIGKQSLILL